MSSTFLITAPTFHRKRVFQNERYGEALTEILMRCRQESRLLLHDYVLMPDHMHLLVTGKGNVDVVGAVSELQKAFVDVVRREFGYSGEVWDANLIAHEIHDSKEYVAAARHIHSNPVRVGFCDDEVEYRLSSKSSRWVLDPLPEHLRSALQTAL